MERKAFIVMPVNGAIVTVQMRMNPPGADTAQRQHPFVRSNDKVVKVKSATRSKSRRTKHHN